ncbi:MAG: pilus assembly protein TadG-related protein, partial [Chloroflexota bacterium]
MRPRLDAQIMPLFALFASLVLLPLAALTLDGGTLYLQRRTAQNAADAAALAGAGGGQQGSA